MSTKLIDARAALLTNLARCMVVLEASDNEPALAEVLAGMGYASISNAHSSADLRGAIELLAELIDVDDLAAVVHVASFHVAVGGVDNLDKAASDARWAFADRQADATLAECGRGILDRFIERVNDVAGSAVHS